MIIWHKLFLAWQDLVEGSGSELRGGIVVFLFFGVVPILIVKAWGMRLRWLRAGDLRGLAPFPYNFVPLNRQEWKAWGIALIVVAVLVVILVLSAYVSASR